MKQVSLEKDRSGGPGGQHRNKVETRVTLTHEETGISAVAGERRSAVENRRVAIRRLRLALATEARCPVPLGEIASDLWRSRRRLPRRGDGGGKIVCNPDHADYPALLAEAMDVIADAGWDVKKAALRLEVTPSQLVKLVKDHPPAFDLLNRQRKAMGKHTYN